MSWRDRLQPASFRGITFGVEDCEERSGRRIVEFDFPGRDDGKLDDQGAAATYHSVSAFVIGEDFDLRATELRDALKKRGTGELVLPRVGSVTVQVMAYRRRDYWSEGRVARFDIESREVPTAETKGSRGSPTRSVEAAADDARDAGKGAVADDLETDGSPFVRDATSGAMSVVSGAMNAVRFVGGVQKRVAMFTDRARDFALSISELITAPADLAASVVDAVDLIGAAGMEPRDALRAYDGFLDLPPGLKGGDTPEEVAADRNRLLVVDLAALAALAGSAVAAAAVVWSSVEEATGARRRLFDQIDVVAGRTSSDDVYQALQELRARILATVPGSVVASPPALLVELPETMPALVAAYRFLDDAEQADAIAEANHVSNPLFLPGGSTVRVVNRGGA